MQVTQSAPYFFVTNFELSFLLDSSFTKLFIFVKSNSSKIDKNKLLTCIRLFIAYHVHLIYGILQVY